MPGCISTCVEAGWGLAGRCRGESAGRFDAGRQRVSELSVDRLVKRRADGEKGLDGMFQYAVGCFRFVAVGGEDVLAEVVEPRYGVAGDLAGVHVDVETEVLLCGPVHGRESGVVGRYSLRSAVAGLGALVQLCR